MKKKTWKIVLILSLIGNLSIIYVAIKTLEYRSHINEWLDKYNNVVDEFSGRSYYEEQNSSLAADSIIIGRVVFLGTQVTADWELKSSFSEWETINRGVPGQRVCGFLLRFRPDVIELGPELVVIEVSSYNFRKPITVDEIFDYFVALLDLARANGITPVPTTMIPPCRDSAYIDNYSVMDSIGVYNALLKKYCDNNKIAFADFNKVLADSDGYLIPEYASGAVDLNEKGYQLTGKEVISAMNKTR